MAKAHRPTRRLPPRNLCNRARHAPGATPGILRTGCNAITPIIGKGRLPDSGDGRVSSRIQAQSKCHSSPGRAGARGRDATMAHRLHNHQRAIISSHGMPLAPRDMPLAPVHPVLRDNCSTCPDRPRPRQALRAPAGQVLPEGSTQDEVVKQGLVPTGKPIMVNLVIILSVAEQTNDLGPESRADPRGRPTRISKFGSRLRRECGHLGGGRLPRGRLAHRGAGRAPGSAASGLRDAAARHADAPRPASPRGVAGPQQGWARRLALPRRPCRRRTRWSRRNAPRPAPRPTSEGSGASRLK